MGLVGFTQGVIIQAPRAPDPFHGTGSLIRPFVNWTCLTAMLRWRVVFRIPSNSIEHMTRPRALRRQTMQWKTSGDKIGALLCLIRTLLKFEPCLTDAEKKTRVWILEMRLVQLTGRPLGYVAFEGLVLPVDNGVFGMTQTPLHTNHTTIVSHPLRMRVLIHFDRSCAPFRVKGLLSKLLRDELGKKSASNSKKP